MSTIELREDPFSVQGLVTAMLGSKDIRHRFLVSVGAMSVFLPFLRAKKVLELQALNTFMYKTGVGRIQERLSLIPELIYFSHSNGAKYRNHIFAYDTVNQKPK